MNVKVLICYYSLTGHLHQLAKAEKNGIDSVDGCEGVLRRVKETLSEEVIDKMGARKFQEEMSDIPVCTTDDLIDADAVIFGTPTRFGNMCGQMRQFLDSTGGVWKKKGLVGKVGGVFTGSATQHGGQESTILSFHTTMLHHGMIITGLPYIFDKMNDITEINGCSPYGASTITGNKAGRNPSEIELEGARFQGRYIALLTQALKESRDEILHEVLRDNT